jgi:hypothetical protein
MPLSHLYVCVSLFLSLNYHSLFLSFVFVFLLLSLYISSLTLSLSSYVCMCVSLNSNSLFLSFVFQLPLSIYLALSSLLSHLSLSHLSLCISLYVSLSLFLTNSLRHKQILYIHTHTHELNMKYRSINFGGSFLTSRFAYKIRYKIQNFPYFFDLKKKEVEKLSPLSFKFRYICITFLCFTSKDISCFIFELSYKDI